MLHDFLTANRDEVVARWKVKAARRFEPSTLSIAADQGIPLFLQQVVETLRAEQSHPTTAESPPAPAPTAIGRAAALHGVELLRQGYSIDLVVHDYGDVCQAVTELALEKRQSIATNDFRVFNRCLDNAIADAVTAFGKGRQEAVSQGTAALGEKLNSFSDYQRHLLDTAIQSFAALQTGKLGLTGATATAHLHTLHALRALAEVSLSEVRLEAAKSTLEQAKSS